jgi:hypothetical protein
MGLVSGPGAIQCLLERSGHEDAQVPPVNQFRARAQVQCVSLAGQAAVPGQEPGGRRAFGAGRAGWIVASAADGGHQATSRPGWNRGG